MKKLCFILFILISGLIKGQDTLSINFDPLNLPSDTVEMMSYDSFFVFVSNQGSNIVSDTIGLEVLVQDSTGTGLQFLESSTMITVLAPGDSTQFGLNLYYDPLKLHYDINVIVIWPIQFDPADRSPDSLKYFVYVIPPDGFIDMAAIIGLFPNPATDHCFIYNAGKINIEEVRIYDRSGRLIRTEEAKGRLDLSSFSPGLFLLELRFADGSRKTLRLIKQ